MSKNGKGNAFHPKLIAIATSLKMAETAFHAGDYRKGLLFLHSTIRQLRPADHGVIWVRRDGKEVPLFKKIENELRTLDSFKHPGAADKRMEEYKYVYLEWMTVVETWVWEKGYWDNDTYKGMYFPSDED